MLIFLYFPLDATRRLSLTLNRRRVCCDCRLRRLWSFATELSGGSSHTPLRKTHPIRRIPNQIPFAVQIPYRIPVSGQTPNRTPFAGQNPNGGSVWSHPRDWGF